MDYADNFNPKPVKGEKYTTTDGKVVIVDDIQPDEGVVYVFCHYDGEDPNTMYPNKDEWESMFSYIDTPTGGSTPANTPTGGNTPIDSPTGGSTPANTPTGGNTPIDSPIGGSTPIDSPTGGKPSTNVNHDNDFNEYLKKVIEPINKLKKLLQNGIILPFQILKLESDEEIPAQFSDPNVTNTCQEDIERIESLRKKGEKDENRGSWFEEKMWTLGAFDKPMLRMFKQDHGAKTGLGAAIFMTSLLAFFTGAYAFYKISDHIFFAFVVGMIWSSMIYVLDRNIVTSMNYTGNKHWFHKYIKPCLSVGLRLVISVFIGMVISAPIEMLIFSGKIDEYKNFEHEQFVKKEIAKSENDLAKDLIANRNDLNIQLDKITDKLKDEENDPHAKGRGHDYREYKLIEKEILNAINENDAKIRGLAETYKIRNKEFTESAEKKWKKHEDFFDLSTDLAILYKVTSKVEEQNETEKYVKHEKTKSNDASNERTAALPDENVMHDVNQDLKSNNLQTDLKNRVNIISEDTEINPALPQDNTMHNCRFFITLLLVLLEVVPVLTKLFFRPGDYDLEMVRWSYLKAKLHRIENANSYNQTINGALSTHRKYILGDEFEDIEKALQSDENHENDNTDDIDNISLPIKGCLRTAKDYNDWRNLRRWKFAIMKADDYLEEEINKLFPQMASVQKSSQPVQHQQSTILSSPVDPSAGGETID